MVKKNVAPFAQDPRSFDAIITAPITNLNTDAPSGLVLLVEAGAEGGIIPRLSAMPRANLTTNAGLVLFVSRDQGATMRPKGSATMLAQTLTATAGPVETDFQKYSEARPLRLGKGERLYVGSLVSPPSGGIAVYGEISDF